MGSRRDLYVGRAGQRAVMGELLFRGYNVAVPDADVGDDLFVVADETGRLWRVQVKTSTLRARKQSGAAKGQFWVPLGQLVTPKRPELHYVLAGRWAAGWWEYVVISRKALLRLREERGFGTVYRGRLLVAVTFRPGSVRGYGVDVQRYRNGWGRYWPVQGGIGGGWGIWCGQKHD